MTAKKNPKRKKAKSTKPTTSTTPTRRSKPTTAEVRHCVLCKQDGHDKRICPTLEKLKPGPYEIVVAPPTTGLESQVSALMKEKLAVYRELALQEALKEVLQGVVTQAYKTRQTLGELLEALCTTNPALGARFLNIPIVSFYSMLDKARRSGVLPRRSATDAVKVTA